MMRRSYCLTGKRTELGSIAPKLFEALAGILLCLVLLRGCAGCKQMDARTAVGIYSAEHFSCVHEAHTLEQSKACRHEVDCKWGILPKTECP